jgi:hypothetical protein
MWPWKYLLCTCLEPVFISLIPSSNTFMVWNILKLHCSFIKCTFLKSPFWMLHKKKFLSFGPYIFPNSCSRFYEIYFNLYYYSNTNISLLRIDRNYILIKLFGELVLRSSRPILTFTLLILASWRNSHILKRGPLSSYCSKRY